MIHYNIELFALCNDLLYQEFASSSSSPLTPLTLRLLHFIQNFFPSFNILMQRSENSGLRHEPLCPI